MFKIQPSKDNRTINNLLITVLLSVGCTWRYPGPRNRGRYCYWWCHARGRGVSRSTAQWVAPTSSCLSFDLSPRFSVYIARHTWDLQNLISDSWLHRTSVSWKKHGCPSNKVVIASAIAMLLAKQDIVIAAQEQWRQKKILGHRQWPTFDKAILLARRKATALLHLLKYLFYPFT